MKNNKRQKSFILIPVIAIILLVLWGSGLTGIWSQGMSYIANNPKDFTDTKGRILEGDHSIAIDLSNLESNVGKDLYE